MDPRDIGEERRYQIALRVFHRNLFSRRLGLFSQLL